MRFEMDWQAYITTDPNVMHGAACFRGTRVPVSVVLDNLADNETAERILDQYPSLKREHISAAIAYAAELARERIVSSAVAEKLAAVVMQEYLQERAKRGSRRKFRKALSKVKDVRPDDYDAK